MGVVRHQSWSHARTTSWTSCPRAYWYEYLSAEEEGLESVSTLARLKHPEAVAGIVVDAFVNEALRRADYDSDWLDELPRRGVEALAIHLANSPRLAERLRHCAKPREGEYILADDYYGQPITDVRRQRCLTMVEQALDGFVRSPLLERLRRCSPSALKFVPTRLPTYQLDGLKVYSPFDLMVTSGDRTLIIDWKAGIPSDIAKVNARRQLGIYASYAIARRIGKPGNVYIQAAWLRDAPDWAPEAATDELIETTQAEIKHHSSEVASRLNQGFNQAGLPIMFARHENFAPKPQARRCGECRFRGLCSEGLSVVREGGGLLRQTADTVGQEVGGQ